MTAGFAPGVPGARYDAIVVGGGPAGLSAAQILGRCRRRVLVVDAGHPRNAAADAVHGFLSRDGIAPAELLRVAREELRHYGVAWVDGEAIDARCLPEGGFELTLGDHQTFSAHRLLLATGVVDRVPRIEGIDAFYGSTVVHCPLCDGWELRDRALAAYGRGAAGCGLAIALRGWSDDVVLCTDGPSRLRPRDLTLLAHYGIAVRTARIVRLEGQGRQLERLMFADGTSMERGGMFFSAGQRQRSDLPLRLGCTITPRGAVRTLHYQHTDVPGVYAVGDASPNPQLAIIAAAEGAQAAYAIHLALQDAERAHAERRAGVSPHVEDVARDRAHDDVDAGPSAAPHH